MLHFTKMHGTGNDYVYVNGFQETVKNPSEVSKFVSERHFGIGSDGLILILPSKSADFRMQMFNADGSEGNMCGNGIRCVGKYVYDNHLTDKLELAIESKVGIKYLKLFAQDGKVTAVEVDMGKAMLNPKDIPMLAEGESFISKPILVGGREYTATCVSVGNPHAVLFTSGIDALDLEKLGPQFEHHPLFPHRVNTEFIEVIDRHTLRMRVWERGSGETFACGTGACASVVAAVVNGHCGYDAPVTVHLRGGDLVVTYTQDGSVTMRGSATTVFEGTIELPEE